MVAGISGEAAAGASDAVSSSLLGSLPAEAAKAVVEGDEGRDEGAPGTRRRRRTSQDARQSHRRAASVAARHGQRGWAYHACHDTPHPQGAPHPARARLTYQKQQVWYVRRASQRRGIVGWFVGMGLQSHL